MPTKEEGELVTREDKSILDTESNHYSKEKVPQSVRVACRFLPCGYFTVSQEKLKFKSEGPHFLRSTQAVHTTLTETLERNHNVALALLFVPPAPVVHAGGLVGLHHVGDL